MEHLEIITIIGSIIGAVLASWGGVFLNNLYQFKAQKENHERRMKTEVFAKTAKALSESRSLLAHLPTLSTEEVYNSMQQDRIPPEFFLWASDETIRAALDLCLVIMEEISRLILLKVNIDAKAEVLKVIINNQHPYELCAKKKNEIYALTEKLINECRYSYTQSEIAEIKIIACIRREYGTAFNEERYREMANANNNKCAEIMKKHDADVAKIQDNMIAEKKKYSRASHN